MPARQAQTTPSRPLQPPRSPTSASDAFQAPAPRADDFASELAFARRLLDAEAQAVRLVGPGLDHRFAEAITLLVRCASAHGTVLVTGLGKSGIVGQKMAATLASLGIASHFVHPAEAAHGDLGRFRSQDVCIALSYSGETEEVVNLAAILRQDQVPVIAITGGNGKSDQTHANPTTLVRLASVSLEVGLCDDPEMTPAPMCSTTAMLALGDCLALCAARRRDFTDSDFAKRHPGGSLGGLLRPVTEAIRFVVGKTLNTVADDVSVAEACRLSETSVRRPGAILLVDRNSGVLTGLFTDADLRRLIERDRSALDRPIADVMTTSPGTLQDTALVRDAVQMVREFRRDEIPVVDAGGRPVGLLDVQDLIALRLIRSE